MAEQADINAKLVYYGAPGAGKSANVACIHRKLKRGHRGEMQTLTAATGGEYEILPIRPGKIRGFETSIDIIAVPGGPEHSDARRDLLANTDGVVFVADLRDDRYAATLDALRELQSNLRTHGRSLREIPLVIQYNHRDESSENSVERMHRSIKLKPAASFEAVATEGTGVLPCLTTISKLILSALRQRADQRAAGDDFSERDIQTAEVDMPEPETPASPAAPAPERRPEPESRSRPVPPPTELHRAIPAAPATENRAASVAAKGFVVSGVGQARAQGNEIRLPVHLLHEESGEAVELELTLSLR
jgi:signal recognition particle receptor subunit beta